MDSERGPVLGHICAAMKFKFSQQLHCPNGSMEGNQTPKLTARRWTLIGVFPTSAPNISSMAAQIGIKEWATEGLTLVQVH